MEADFPSVEWDVAWMESDDSCMKSRIAWMKWNDSPMETGFAWMESKFSSVEQAVTWMEWNDSSMKKPVAWMKRNFSSVESGVAWVEWKFSSMQQRGTWMDSYDSSMKNPFTWMKRDVSSTQTDRAWMNRDRLNCTNAHRSRTMKRALPIVAVSVLLVAMSCPTQAEDGGASGLVSVDQDNPLGKPDAAPFQETALTVRASPASAISYQLAAGLSVRDFEVSPAGDKVALVTEDAQHRQQVAWWHFDAAGLSDPVEVPAATRIASLTWRPDAGRLFVLATDGQGSQILGLDPAAKTYAATILYQSAVPLRRLVVGPRPFEGSKGVPAYRLFFGQQLAGGRFALRTVTERGQVPYTVVGPGLDPQFVKSNKTGTPPSFDPPNTTIAPSALPLAFHPAGNALVWEDARGCLHKKPYEQSDWAKSMPFGSACGSTVTYAQNGAATLEWSAAKQGLRIRGLIDGSDRTEVASVRLASAPSQMPDGKGVVGLTRDAGRTTLRFLPLDLPLADVANAWMFLGNADDQQRFVRDRGLFRNLPDKDQIYQLYDSESYAGDLDLSAATRPYFVTTDLFWELYGATFDGLFIVVERERAIPAFRTFVAATTNALRLTHPGSGLATQLAAAQAVLEHREAGNPEAQRILAANFSGTTPLGNELDYAQLKPRGHYKTEEQQRYFRAMRYLSLTRLSEADAQTLRKLGPNVAKAAAEWIGSYRPFIAASRLDLVWGSDAAKAPIASHPDAYGGIGLFPLSWAWDNEALDNVIYHDNWPVAEKIESPAGMRRLLPSGLDFAAILGNADARQLLGDQGLIATYPNLAVRIAATSRRFVADRQRRPTTSLYEKWMTALATQWADDALAPGISGPLWNMKRLQTGLASWATLRHSTILVNDQTSAEAGEGGFERIVMAPPRGFVEPDPATFGAIADLFDATIAVVNAAPILKGDPANDAAVSQGIVKRLTRSRDDARMFQAIAKKELGGQQLAPDDYAAIEFVGGTVEHAFLVFMSLSNPSYALSNPDPMMKVADVAGARGEIPEEQGVKAGPAGGSLEVAVGRPLEWDQIVPFYGRHEIVKGAIYSYYEFTQPEPIDDAAWRAKVDAQSRPPWIARFLSHGKLVFPATEP